VDRIRVLVADDEQIVRESLASVIGSDPSLEIVLRLPATGRGGRRACTLTVTPASQSSNPSRVVIRPTATRWRRSSRVTSRSCVWTPVTSKSSALVAVPPGVVTAIGPSAAPAGTSIESWSRAPLKKHLY